MKGKAMRVSELWATVCYSVCFLFPLFSDGVAVADPTSTRLEQSTLPAQGR